MNKSQYYLTTRWTLIAHAGDPHHPRVQQAFAELYQLYTGPIYWFFRRSNFNDHEAEDLVQSFFYYAYESQMFAGADKARGRFRSFVSKCLKHFLVDEHRRAAALKRGGRGKPISFDALTEEQRYLAEPVDDRSPDKLFQHKMAIEIFRNVMKELEAEAIAEGEGDLFITLRNYLGREGNDETYQALSARLNRPVGTLKSLASRFRKRAREILEDRIRQIVASEAEVKAEIIDLENEL